MGEDMAMAGDHAYEKWRGVAEGHTSEEQKCPDLKRHWQRFDLLKCCRC
jgi:hypothetical protein